MPLSPELQSKNDRLSAMGKGVPPYSWWSTWLSSKNRFHAPIELEQREEPMGFTLIKAIRMTLILGFQILAARLLLRPKLPLGGVLIKTFAYSHSFKGEKFHDPFFPGLYEYVNEKVSGAVVQVYDPLLCFRAALRFSKRHPAVQPWMAFSRLKDLFWAWKHMFSGTRGLRSDRLGWNSLIALTLGRAMGRLAKEMKPKRLILSTEFNPWERITILEVRKYSPKTEIAGVQHTVVPEACGNMFPGIGELENGAPVPDFILTVGEETKLILEEYGQYGSLPIRAACALRFRYLEKIKPLDFYPIPKKLLIAMEGTVNAHEPLTYALKEIENLKGWVVRIRTHPARPIELLEKDVPFRFRHWPHLEISPQGTSLEDDLKNSGVVYYWGSSVSLEALCMGIPIIHFDHGRALSYDPLFKFSHLKWKCGPGGESLKEILEKKIERMTREELMEGRARGTEYLKRYFHPVNEDTLSLFLK